MDQNVTEYNVGLYRSTTESSCHLYHDLPSMLLIFMLLINMPLPAMQLFTALLLAMQVLYQKPLG